MRPQPLGTDSLEGNAFRTVTQCTSVLERYSSDIPPGIGVYEQLFSCEEPTQTHAVGSDQL